MARAHAVRTFALASILSGTQACRGDGTFFAVILDGGGGSGGFAGFGGGFPFDSGMDSGSACIECGPGCFDCGLGCTCDPIDAGPDGSTALPWSSPFPNTGAPGWRDSTEPLCGRFGLESQLLERAPVAIWSDARGVFAALRSDSSVSDDLDAGTPFEQVVVYTNAGVGWQVLHRVPLGPLSVWEDSPGLAGVLNGPLWLHDVVLELGAESACTLVTLEDASARCNAVNERVRLAFGVSAERAFAVSGTSTLLAFDGTRWTPHANAIPDEARGLWADASSVIVASDDALYRLTTTGWERDALPFSGVSAIWARSSSHVWLGTEDGEVWLFDGQAWQRISVLGGVSCARPDAVRGIWGAGDTLYFHGATTLQRWNGATVENLGNWSCSPTVDSVSIKDLWGNSADDVFLALRDRRGGRSSCSDIVVMSFDGTQFHRM